MIMKRWCYLDGLSHALYLLPLIIVRFPGYMHKDISCMAIVNHRYCSWIWYYNLWTVLAQESDHLEIEKWKNFGKSEY